MHERAHQHRAGIDLVSVEEVEQAIADHGDRYLRRVYTERELADCRGAGGDVSAERLAARFAAKEATIKVLRPVRQAIPWTAIEVRRAPGGWTDLVLDGAAARLADEGGVGGLALSLSHEGRYACAVVMGTVRDGDDR